MQLPLHIKILYGSSWGFPQRYEELASLLSRKIKTTNLTISGRKVNRKAAFEIFFNDVCVHSKVGTYYHTRNLCNETALVILIKKYSICILMQTYKCCTIYLLWNVLMFNDMHVWSICTLWKLWCLSEKIHSILLRCNIFNILWILQTPLGPLIFLQCFRNIIYWVKSNCNKII